MKKWIALLVTLMLLAVSFAVAEDTDVNFVPDEEWLQFGSMQTIQLSSATAFDMFILNNWERDTTEDFWSFDTIAKWTNEENVKMEAMLVSFERAGFDSIEDMYTKIDEQGFIPSIFNVNGIENVCFFAKEDPLAQIGMGMVLPEGVFMIAAGPFNTEDQAEDAMLMFTSICQKEMVVADIGLNIGEMDMQIGACKTVSVNKVPMFEYYAYNKFVSQDQDTYSNQYVFDRMMDEDGVVLELARMPVADMRASSVLRDIKQAKDAGYAADLYCINGIDAVGFNNNTEMGITEMGVMFRIPDGSTVMIRVMHLSNEDQAIEARRMIRSISIPQN